MNEEGSMNEEELRTLLEQAPSNDAWLDILVRHFDAHELFFGHGTENADDEAYWLLRHLQEWRDDRWDGLPDATLATAAASVAIRRVRERIPLAYLLEEAWFAGLRFKVDSSVLIPRSPLAEVIENRFEPWCQLRPGDRVLDVGTGSGCIAIATAHYCPDVTVDATDVAADALAIARENVEAHSVADRVSLLKADLFPSECSEYRVIISNPPYVPDSRLRELPAEYGYEPAMALAGGPDGLEPTRRLLNGARTRLAPGGAIIIEVGESAESLQAAYPGLPATWIEFERGGGGVFVLMYEDLESADW